jgi:di/tricarboxylate transporter
MNAPTPTPIRSSDDWLDAALRAEGAAHRAGYVDDDGFTARLMAALPPPVAALPDWRRKALFGLWAAAAVGTAFALPGTMAEVTREVLRIVAGHPVSLPGIVTGVVALFAASWAGVGVALRRA